MNTIIQDSAEKHLFYLCIAVATLWLVWILFNHWFAPEEFINFLITRFAGSILSLALIMNHYRKWGNVFSAQLIMFSIYNGILSYYISSVTAELPKRHPKKTCTR
jgi:hypothetical protein